MAHISVTFARDYFCAPVGVPRKCVKGETVICEADFANALIAEGVAELAAQQPANAKKAPTHISHIEIVKPGRYCLDNANAQTLKAGDVVTAAAHVARDMIAVGDAKAPTPQAAIDSNAANAAPLATPPEITDAETAADAKEKADGENNQGWISRATAAAAAIMPGKKDDAAAKAVAAASASGAQHQWLDAADCHDAPRLALPEYPAFAWQPRPAFAALVKDETYAKLTQGYKNGAHAAKIGDRVILSPNKGELEKLLAAANA